MRLAVICYRCLQILMVSTLWMDRALSGIVIIALVVAGEIYHWWYARQMQWAQHEIAQDLISAARSIRQVRSNGRVARHQDVLKRRSVGD